MSPMNNHLYWRYATQKFDPTRKIPKKDLDELLEVLRIAPSSYGLQPWKFIVIQNETLRKELQRHAWNQPQVTDASHLIVFCALKIMDERYVKDFVTRIAQVRDVNRETLSGYERAMLDSFKNQTPAQLSHWMKLQVYLALGMFLAECAQEKIDACPMEGFEPQKFDEVLGLEKQGLESVVLCPIGYRARDDRYAKLKKVRFEKNEVVIHLR